MDNSYIFELVISYSIAQELDLNQNVAIAKIQF